MLGPEPQRVGLPLHTPDYGSQLSGMAKVFVLDDGGEVDLDLGNYERYLHITLTRENNITTGKIYKESDRPRTKRGLSRPNSAGCATHYGCHPRTGLNVWPRYPSTKRTRNPTSAL